MSPRIGAIVRLNARGLGYQTRDFVKHYGADRVLAVLMPNRKLPDNPWLVETMENVTTITVGTDRVMPEGVVREWLSGLDAVFSAETLYDWRMAHWAAEAGAFTVVQGNPEFYNHHRLRDLPQPSRWIWPTNWLIDELPAGPVVPCPIPDDHEVVAGDAGDDEFRVLHVAGHAAAGDRNGTEAFMKAISKIRTPVTVTVIGQDGWLPDPGMVPRNVTLIPNGFGVADPLDLYRGQHLVVLPRRYGGNCLPANEACAAGCALAMPLVSPNERWPIFPLSTTPGKPHLTPFGPVQTIHVRPEVIATTIDKLNTNRHHLNALQVESQRWAKRNRWSDLRPLYDQALTP